MEQATERNTMKVISYHVRSGPGNARKNERFDTPEEAARHWNGLNDPTSTLMVFDEDHGLWPGTAAQVQPVYDALAQIRNG
jgi:hypothetical protein